jgi:hypothetical protein
VRWVGYAASDFRPPTDRPWGESYNVAHVTQGLFGRFFRRVLRGEHAELNAEYDAQMRATPGPNRSTAFWVHG